MDLGAVAPQVVDPTHPDLIASQFDQIAQQQAAAGQQQPAPVVQQQQQPAPLDPYQQGQFDPRSGVSTPDPAAAPVSPAAAAGQGDVRTTADLAAVFSTPGQDPLTEDAFFGAVTHRIGEVDVPLKDIVDGFIAIPDAKQAIEERAGLQSIFDSKTAQQNETHHTAMSHVAQVHERLQRQLDQYDSPAAMNALLESDPTAYQDRVKQNTARRVELETAEREMQAEHAAQQKRTQGEQDEWLTREAQALSRVFPEYNNPATSVAVQGKLSAYARKMGFSDAELAGVKDHRFIQILRDAEGGSALRAKGRAAIKLATDTRLSAPAPKQAARGELPGAQEQGNMGRATAMQNLRTQQTTAAAADVFNQLLKR